MAALLPVLSDPTVSAGPSLAVQQHDLVAQRPPPPPAQVASIAPDLGLSRPTLLVADPDFEVLCMLTRSCVGGVPAVRPG